MKVEIEIDERLYGMLCRREDAKLVLRLLTDLYRDLYIEAEYDPYSEETKAFARRVLPTIKRLNELIKFKK